jgi:hypothetical protein
MNPAIKRRVVLATVAALSAFAGGPVFLANLCAVLSRSKSWRPLAQGLMSEFCAFLLYPSLAALGLLVVVVVASGERVAFFRPLRIFGLLVLFFFFRAVVGLSFFYGGRHWYEKTIEFASVPAKATEHSVRLALGPPSLKEVAPEFHFACNSPDPAARGARSNLVYIEPGGGDCRVFYFAADGVYLYEQRGQIYF